jgi:hypothetical protein
MEWIKCSERLPKENEEVLVFIKENDSCCAQIAMDYISFPKDGNLWALTYKEFITHWMPLPDDPE